MNKLTVLVFLGALLCVPRLAAQSAQRTAAPQAPNSQSVGHSMGHSVGISGPPKGSREIELWTGGGVPVDLFGSREHTPVWNLGARYGWVLTGLRGPSFLRGRFEYAVDAVPVYLFFQPGRTTYGVGIDPIVLKWNFRRRGNVAPYWEVDGGGVLANHAVPATDSAFNFILNTALGLNFFHGRRAVSVEFRMFHLSDAGLSAPNLGINNLQVRVGFSLFRLPR